MRLDGRIGLLTLLLGGNPGDVIDLATQMGGYTTESNYIPTAEEE